MIGKMATNPIRRLQEYRLTGVQETGVEIGRGSYAAVVELQFRGLKCAGKRLYPHLYSGVGMLQRFEEECEILGKTRHPNIVQFLGVTFEEGSELPTIIMEFMHTTLSSCIDRYGVLPQEVSYSILGDVATALCYLHGNNPQIIHRDLTANNILLTRDMQAKISDLGVAKALGLTPARMTQMTTCPGTPAYMPPEALEHNPTYATSIDSFSYGVTMVHLLSGKWPLPSSATVVDPLNPGRVTGRTEAQRRQEYLDDIGQDHPLMELILECLSNSPNHRLNAEDILQRVRTAAREYQPAFANKMAQIKADNEQREQLQHDMEQVQQRLGQCEILHSFLTKQKQQQNSQLVETNERVTSLLESRTKELSISTSLISAKDQEIQAMTALNSATLQQVRGLTDTIEERDKEIALLQRDVESKIVEADQLKEENDQLISYMNSEYKVSDFYIIHRVYHYFLFFFLQMHPFLSKYSQWTWTQVGALPAQTTIPQCVLINADLYVGGGQTELQKAADRCKVFKYNSHRRSWSELPPAPQKFFGLTSVHGKPTIIGGTLLETSQITGRVLAYDKEENKWLKSIPSMPTPRNRSCAISNNTGILVIGGLSTYSECINTVEIFLYNTNQWHSGTPLPEPRAGLHCTMIGSRVYIMGGFYPSLEVALSKRSCCYTDYLATENLSKNTTLIWNSLPDLPLPGCAPVSINRVLLAIGGTGDLNGVHFYDPKTQLWLRIGNLPEYREALVAATLPNGQIILSGGWNKQRVRKRKTFIGGIQAN